jgi:hypothetical protein
VGACDKNDGSGGEGDARGGGTGVGEGPGDAAAMSTSPARSRTISLRKWVLSVTAYAVNECAKNRVGLVRSLDHGEMPGEGEYSRSGAVYPVGEPL